jgi:sugar lactone lactonase YvrE
MSVLEIVLGGHRCLLGEGPGWDARERRLLFVDIHGEVVHRYDPEADSLETFPVGEPVGAVAPREAGGLVLAVRSGFATLDTASGLVTAGGRVDEGLPGGRMNDGKCDPAGRFWAGTQSSEPSARRSGLYRLDCDGSVAQMLDGVGVSNGLEWSRDGQTLFYVDTAEAGVDAFDYDVATGALSNRRRFVDVAPEHGAPDGLTLDEEGGLWLALFGGSAVHRYTADGVLAGVIDVPASLVTSCAFGGDGLDDLYITTAAHRLERPERNAGALFRARPGVRGRALRRFAG